MNDDSQLVLPAAFADLYVLPGRSKPQLDRTAMHQRHGWCEDLAQSLAEQGGQRMASMGLAESDVLQRSFLGLRQDPSLMSEPEALWVVCRMAELVNWPLTPATLGPLGPQAQAWWLRQQAALVRGA